MNYNTAALFISSGKALGKERSCRLPHLPECFQRFLLNILVSIAFQQDIKSARVAYDTENGNGSGPDFPVITLTHCHQILDSFRSGQRLKALEGMVPEFSGFRPQTYHVERRQCRLPDISCPFAQTVYQQRHRPCITNHAQTFEQSLLEERIAGKRCYRVQRHGAADLYQGLQYCITYQQFIPVEFLKERRKRARISYQTQTLCSCSCYVRIVVGQCVGQMGNARSRAYPSHDIDYELPDAGIFICQMLHQKWNHLLADRLEYFHNGVSQAGISLHRQQQDQLFCKRLSGRYRKNEINSLLPDPPALISESRYCKRLYLA